ncbi:MAG: TetR/AcrR family transcriptional regulator [Anaerolineae bacterium]|nr:TetR/AcrR family transcriptional regulator [Anaerolineae bacterium]
MRHKQKREETRTRILEVAASLFALHGYEATGVAEICHRASVSKGAFYYHFESKQAVFLALAESWLEDLNTSLADILQETGAPDTQLLAMAHRLQHVLASQSARLGLLLEFWTQANRDPQVREVVLAPYRSFRARFAELVQEGVDRGRFCPVDPQAAAQVILSLASGLFFQGLLDPHDADWSEIAETSIEILINGIGCDHKSYQPDTA